MRELLLMRVASLWKKMKCQGKEYLTKLKIMHHRLVTNHSKNKYVKAQHQLNPNNKIMDNSLQAKKLHVIYMGRV